MQSEMWPGTYRAVGTGVIGMFRRIWRIRGVKKSPGPKKDGAGDEIRTRDINLGKVALYQLSYSRLNNANYYFAQAAPDLSNQHDEARVTRRNVQFYPTALPLPEDKTGAPRSYTCHRHTCHNCA